MTTMDGNPGMLQFLAWKLNRLAKAREANKATRTLTWLQATIRLVLQLGGFAGLTTAAFILHIAAGCAVAGISCFVLSWLTTTTSEDSPQQTQRR